MRFTLPALLFATPALADPGEYNRMMDYGHGYGYGMIFGPVLWLIIIGLIVAGIIWFVRKSDGPQTRATSGARAELDMRFARGEIDAEDYAARKKLLAD